MIKRIYQNIYKDKDQQRSVFVIFIGFTIISFLTSFTITSLYLSPRFTETISEIEQNTRASELRSLGKNVEYYIKNRVQTLKDLSSKPTIKYAIEHAEFDNPKLQKLLDSTIILGDTPPLVLFDIMGNEVATSQDYSIGKLNENEFQPILAQGQSYLTSIKQDKEKAKIQILVPILYDSLVHGFMATEIEVNYQNIFGLFNPSHTSYALQMAEKKVCAENYNKFEGIEYQKYIGDLDLIIFFKVNNDFQKSKAKALLIDLLLSIFASTILSTIVLFLLGKNMIVMPYIKLAENRQLLSKKTKELEQSNQELDRFAYIISHDLKEPIRGMTVYAELVSKQNQNTLDQKSQEKLNTISKLGQKAALMLSQILEYSRSGRVADAYQETNLDNVIEDVIFSLQIFLNEHNAKVVIPQQLPSIICDRVRVGEVFKNFITNGVKYNNKEEKNIEIGYKRDEENHLITFYVQDNGDGIEEKYFESIFEIFSRINNDDKGTGVGLSLVSKIIKNHNGEIKVESTLGKGTRFSFHFGEQSWL